MDSFTIRPTISWKGSNVVFELESDNTVRQLKEAIHKQFDIEPALQKLLLRGKVLNADSVTFRSLLPPNNPAAPLKIQLLANNKEEVQSFIQRDKQELEARQVEEALARIEAEERQKRAEEEARLAAEREARRQEEARRRQEVIEQQNRERRQREQEAMDVEPAASLSIDLRVFPSVFSNRSSTQIEESNKLLLPAEVLQRINELKVPYPLTFEITNATTGKRIWASVLDFTAENGTSYLPLSLFTDLGAEEGGVCSFKTVTLAKAEFAKLQPLSLTWLFIDEEKRKIMLEAGLRSHQHLSQNQHFFIHNGDQTFEFAVLELQPAEAVAITDSDLVVDVVEPADSARFEPAQIQEPHSVVQFDSPQQFAFFKFEITDPNANKAVNLISTQGSFDVVIANNTRFPTTKNYQWSSLGANKASILLSNQDDKFVVGPYFVGVYAITPTLQATISVTNAVGNAVHAIGASAVGSGPQPPNTSLCSNCAKYIPSGTYALHEAQCKRRNYRCELCNAVVPVEEKSLHHSQQHSTVTCPECSQWTGSPDLLALHKQFECQNRPFACPYCQIDVPFASRAAHMKSCGTRTHKCEHCGENVRNYDKMTHMASKHPR